MAEQYKDQPITLFTMMNLPHSRQWDIGLSFSPTIRVWRPVFSLEMSQQNLSYKGKTYNKPMVSYRFQNIIQLPKSIKVVANISGTMQGESDLSLNKSVFRTDLRISKLFLHDQLNVMVGANDVFATDLERWSMTSGHLYSYKWDDGDNRSLYLKVTYSFNTTRSKYKGEGVNNSEIDRF